jgi:hypothetical protein
MAPYHAGGDVTEACKALEQIGSAEAIGVESTVPFNCDRNGRWSHAKCLNHN